MAAIHEFHQRIAEGFDDLLRCSLRRKVQARGRRDSNHLLRLRSGRREAVLTDEPGVAAAERRGLRQRAARVALDITPLRWSRFAENDPVKTPYAYGVMG